MAGRALTLAVCLVLLAPGAASASLATVKSTGEFDEFFYTATKGKQNRVTVTSDGFDATVRDPGEVIVAGPGCVSQGPHVAECPLAGNVIANVAVGNRRDVVRVGGGAVFLRAEGGPGADKMVGGGFPDLLDGGRDPDVLKGRGSGDTATYASRSRGVRVTLGDGKRNEGNRADGARRDRLVGIESVLGGSGNDVLIGNGLGNRLRGLDGRDVVRGKAGDDDLDTGAARDRAFGGSGADLFVAGDGNDRYFGGRGDDHFQDGFLDGGDLQAGGPGHDTAQHQNGANRLSLDGRANDGNCAGAQCRASFEGDNLVSIEELLVGFGDDVLIGSRRAEVFNPFPGADLVRAKGGNDVINVAVDNDVDIFDCGPGIDQIVGTPDAFDQNPNCE